MSTFRHTSDHRGAVRRWSAAVVWLGCLMLLGPVADAHADAAARGESASAGHPNSRSVAARSNAAKIVDDVTVHADGGLRGRVVGGRSPVELGGRRVSFVLGQRTMAATVTAADGRFGVRNLPGGMYRVAVDGGGTSHGRWVRVLDSSSSGVTRWASEICVPIGGPTVRGQPPSPFPIMSLQQAATVGGIAAGAVAVPVVYHNMLMDNRVPATP